MRENTWIIIANAAFAHIYLLNHKFFQQDIIKISLLHSYEHPDSRKKDSELVADKSGAYRSGEAGFGDFTSPTDPKEHEAEVFAMQLAKELEAARTSNQYTDLILIASPHFTGLMKKHLNKNVLDLIKTYIEKDYTQIPINRLMKYLDDHLIEKDQ
jgi:protein required for attachment to host cells